MKCLFSIMDKKRTDDHEKNTTRFYLFKLQFICLTSENTLNPSERRT